LFLAAEAEPHEETAFGDTRQKKPTDFLSEANLTFVTTEKEGGGVRAGRLGGKVMGKTAVVIVAEVAISG
jgi:hypothetical protein